MAPIVKKSPTSSHRISTQVIEMIFSFVVSSKVTQEVAYGTLNMNQPTTGKKVKIAKVIRTRRNEEIYR